MRCILLLFIFSLVFSGCQQGKEVSDESIPLPQLTIKNEGTDTGGGLFEDEEPKRILKIAKHSLAEMIRNVSSEAFVDFPEGRGQYWLVDLIKKIEVNYDLPDKRYGRDLVFNYSLEKDQVFATKNFVKKVPFGRLESFTSIEKVRLIQETMLDILHEVSHLYGIGTTEELDEKSEQWAKDFLFRGLDENLFCQRTNQVFTVHLPSSLALINLWAPTSEFLRQELHSGQGLPSVVLTHKPDVFRTWEISEIANHNIFTNYQRLFSQSSGEQVEGIGVKNTFESLFESEGLKSLKGFVPVNSLSQFLGIKKTQGESEGPFELSMDQLCEGCELIKASKEFFQCSHQINRIRMKEYKEDLK